MKAFSLMQGNPIMKQYSPNFWFIKLGIMDVLVELFQEEQNFGIIILTWTGRFSLIMQISNLLKNFVQLSRDIIAPITLKPKKSQTMDAYRYKDCR